jgi:hypothetical protein
MDRPQVTGPDEAAEPTVECRAMSSRLCAVGAVVVLCFTGCKESGGSEANREGEKAASPAAQTVRAFYAAADKSAGEKACALLTDSGIRAIVHVRSRTACTRTIDGFAPGSFSDESGSLVRIDGVDDHADGFDVDAAVKGRSGGAYSIVERNGRLVIDGFTPEEG